MTTDDRIPEARLTAGLTELAGPSTPGLRDDILAATARTRQRSAWSYPERWLPMAVITRPAVAPSLRPLWLLLIALLLTALAFGGAIVGGSLLRADAVIPTGGEAVYAFSSAAGQDIYTVRADGTDLRRLTSSEGTTWWAPQFSPDGTHIAVRAWKAGTELIVVMDAGGGDPITIATYATPRRDCIRQLEVAWSPDGSALAYPISDGCSTSGHIDIASADGTSPPVPLLGIDLDAMSPSWSPDGTQMAFAGSDGGGAWGVYVAPGSLPAALGGGLMPRRIGTGPIDPWSPPRWSPNGSELAVTTNATGEFGNEAIDAVKADGSGQRLVVDRAYRPDWSPDGRRLSFAQTVDPSEYWNDRPCTVRYGTVGVDGTDQLMLDPLGDGCEYSAMWSPDGTLLAALLIASTPESPELTWHLGFVPVDGRAAPVVLADDSPGGSWQPVAAPLPPAPSFPAAS